ncbi:MAG: HAD hydrolase-like protein [Candidatus Polarisedimenticolia bacterium]
MNLPAGVRGFLFDVDGTLVHKDRALPGAAEALARLRRAGLAFRPSTSVCPAALVLTGKTRRQELDDALRRPDLVLESVADLTP